MNIFLGILTDGIDVLDSLKLKAIIGIIGGIGRIRLIIRYYVAATAVSRVA